jgi:hypothetical protein
MPHYIAWEYDRRLVVARLVCDEPVGALCRLKCVDACCETFAVQWDQDGEPWHVEGGVWQHMMCDGGHCNVELFVNEDPDGPIELGPREVREIARTPINPSWEGDSYSWTFAPEPSDPHPADSDLPTHQAGTPGTENHPNGSSNA